jgi:hypothetical protein
LNNVAKEQPHLRISKCGKVRKGAEENRVNRIRRTTPYGVRGAVRKTSAESAELRKCGNKCGNGECAA